MNPARRPILLLLPQQAKVLMHLRDPIKIDFLPLTKPRYIAGFGGNIRSLPLTPSTPTPPSHPKPRRDYALQRSPGVDRFTFFWRMLCLLMGLPGGFEIKMAGEDVVEVVVEPRQDDGIDFHPFEVGGVVATGDDIASGIGGLAVEGQWRIAVWLTGFGLPYPGDAVGG